MNLTPLRYLRLVVEHGSFAAAASAAGVSQPAVSQALQQLQARFEAPLFQRRGRRRQPTALARQLAEGSLELEQQVQALLPVPPPPRPPGLLRVGLTASAARVCGPPLYRLWCQDRPRRQLRMDMGDEGQLINGVQRGSLDLAITPRPRGPLPGGLVAHPLYRITPRIYARRDHPLAGARHLSDLQAAPFASVGAAVAGPVDVLTEAFGVRQLPPPRVVVQCADYASLVQLVGGADLLAVLPHPALLGDSPADGLRPLPLRETLPLYDVVLLHRAGGGRALAGLVPLLVAQLAPGADA